MNRLVPLLLLCACILPSCRKEVLSPVFPEAPQTCDPIPSEGGRCAFKVDYVPTRAAEYRPFEYKVHIDGNFLIGGTVNGPEELEDGKVAFDVPANELYEPRKISAAVLVDGHWIRIFEATQLARIPDRSAFGIVEEMKVGWNLGNTLDSFGDWIALYSDGSTAAYETAWGQPVTTAALIRTFADAGFGAIRVPVTWFQHMDAAGNVSEDWMARVEEVVGYVLDAGLYCILNVHHDTGTGGWLFASEPVYNSVKGRYKALWRQIATRFRDYGPRLLFEGYNELLYTSSWNAPPSSAYTWANSYNQDFVDAVRATGGGNASRFLVVNTYAASHDAEALKGFQLPKDSIDGHLIAEVHSYAPYPFAFDVAGDPYWGPYDKKVFDEDCRKEIVSGIESMAARFVDNGIPCIIGEYGAADKGNESERARQAACYVSTARKYGITCFHWMGLIDGADRSTCTWTNPILKDAILHPEKYQ